MNPIFYSYDGHIWYWGRYSAEDVETFKSTGVKVMADTPRNRRMLR